MSQQIINTMYSMSLERLDFVAKRLAMFSDDIDAGYACLHNSFDPFMSVEEFFEIVIEIDDIGELAQSILDNRTSLPIAMQGKQ